MTPEWPASLPQCPLRGKQRSPRSNVVAFGTEVGQGKLRRRSTARTKSIPMTFRLTRTEVPVFEAFFEDDLLDGSLPFTMYDSTDEMVHSWLFDPQAPYTCAEQASGKWFVSVNLIRIG